MPVPYEYGTSDLASLFYRQNGNKFPDVIVRPENRRVYYLKRIFSQNYEYENFEGTNIVRLNNDISFDEVRDNNKAFLEDKKMGKVSFNDFRMSTYGRSWDNIKDKFVYIDDENVEKFYSELKGKSYNVSDGESFAIEYEFDEPIKGIDYDYICLDINIDNTTEIDNAKLKYFKDQTGIGKDDKYVQIIVSYAGEDEDYADYRTVRGFYDNGQLIIPMGASVNWLNSDISKIKIQFTNLGDGSTVTINDIGLFKYYPLEFDEENEYPVYHLINKVF